MPVLLVAVVAGTWSVLALRRGDSSPILRALPVNAGLMLPDDRAGVVVVAGNDTDGGRLRILGARSGAVLHTVSLPGQIDAGYMEFGPLSTLALDRRVGRAIVTTFDPATAPPGRGHLSVVDIVRGTAIARLSPPTTSMVAIDETRGRAVVVNEGVSTAASHGHTGNVQILDIHTGAVIHTLLANTGPTGAAIDPRSGHAFVVTQVTDRNTGHVGPSIVWTLDLASGRVIRRVAVAVSPWAPAVDSPDGRVFAFSYSVTNRNSGVARVFDARQGNLLHTAPIGSYPWLIMVDAAARRVYVMNRGNMVKGSVSVLDARSGALVRTIRLPASPISMISDERRGRLFVALSRPDANGNADGPGLVSTIDSRSGRILRTVAVGQNLGLVASGQDRFPLALDERRGRLFVAVQGSVGRQGFYGAPKGYGKVAILDARTGSIVRAITVGMRPQAMIVSERTGRLFVATGGGTITVPASDPWVWIPNTLRRHLSFLRAPAAHMQTVPPGINVIDVSK